jgi:tRNA A37 threonylcarbamoyladenosine dehydratase
LTLAIENPVDLTNRNIRQLDVLTSVKQKVYIIGCGSVGSVIAKILGPSGQDMIFYDRDTIELSLIHI